MANDRISDLTTAGPLTGAELFELSQPSGGTPPYNSRKQQLSILASYIQQQLGGGAGAMGPPGLDGADGDDLLMIPGPPGPAGTGGGGGTQNTYLLGNVSPDTHPANPTARDDEFEGTGLASKWTWFNQGGATVTVNAGSIAFFSPAYAGTDNLRSIMQPVSGTAWRYRMKMSLRWNGAAPVLVFNARESSSGKSMSSGMLINPGEAPYFWQPYWTSDSLLNSYANLTSMSTMNAYNGTFHQFNVPMYIEVQLAAGSMTMRASISGADNDFITIGSVTLATNGMSAVDYVGIGIDVGTGFTGGYVGSVDWFRDYTNGYTAATGTPATTTNIAPDSHPLAPTAWDDEFEYGGAIDTSGSRFSGANPWTIYNALTSTNSITNGALLVNSAIGAGGGLGGRAFTMIGQPAPAGTAWRFRSKFAMQSQSSGNLCGICAMESGTQKSVGWGWLFSPTHQVYALAFAYTNFATYNADLDSAIGGSLLQYQLLDPITFKTPMRYWEMERNGANLILRLSDDGYFYQQYITIPIATYFTTAPDTIGLMVDAVSVADATHFYADWFRRAA